MKKHWGSIVLCLLLLGILCQQYVLHKDVSDLTRQQEDLFTQQAGVNRQLREQASLFRELQYAFGELDAQTLCVPLHITAAPKRLQADTKLRLLLADSTHEFTREGDRFVLDAQVDIFDSKLPKITLSLEEGESKQLEDKETYFSREERLPLLSCFIPAVISSTENGYHIRAKLQQTPNTIPDAADQDRFLQILSFTDWKLVATEGSEVVYEEAVAQPSTPSEATDAIAVFEVDLPWRGQAPLGLWVQATDHYGFVHQTLLSSAGYDESGYDDHYPEFYSEWIGEGLLFRADGTLLYAPDGYPEGKAILHRGKS